MSRCRCAFTILLVIVGSCRTLPHAEVPTGFAALPWTGSSADESVLQARAEVEQGHTKAGLDLIEEVLRKEPHHTDALRLRQDILRDRGRRGLLLFESQQAVAKGDDALAFYLQGRIVDGNAAKLRSFSRAVELAPGAIWPWLGLAYTLRHDDPDRAESIYARLYAATQGHPLVAVAYGMLLREREKWDKAAAVYTELAKDARLPGVGQLGLAQIGLARQKETDAWPRLIEAERLRPFDPNLQALVQRWLQAGIGSEREGELFDALREDPAALQSFGTGDGALVLAELLQRNRQPFAAAELLANAKVTARQPTLRRMLRRALLGTGDVSSFLAMVRADVPRALVAAEPNRLRARWLLLLDGPWYDGDALASATQSADLLEALLRTGFVAEVEQLAAFAMARWPDCAALAAKRDEARRELAFEAAIRRLLYQGYRDGRPTSVEQMLVSLRAMSERIFGRDVVGEPTIFRAPLVGEMIDPLTGDLAAHFDRYNRHFVLGRRSGGVAEGMLLSRLSLAELPPEPRLPLAGPCHEVIAMDRDVRSMSGVVGGDLAGVALLNHYVVDFDSVREWARTIADRRRVSAEDGDALLHDPLPADAGMDPLDVAWRLAVLSPVRDSELDEAVLDTIRMHERQHLVDSFRFLPFEHNLGRGLSLLFGLGFSALAVEAEMERRAELASLAVSPHTRIVLAHIADFLREPEGDSPHQRGFSELAHQLVAALQRQGVPSAQAMPSQWHLLDPVVIRAAASELLERVH